MYLFFKSILKGALIEIFKGCKNVINPEGIK